jgi:hypothetical protein
MTGSPHQQVHGNLIADSDGDGPYVLGSGVNVKKGTAAYTDTADKVLFTLPAGAILLLWIIDKSTAFNDSGTDQLNIGDGTTYNQFLSALDVSATGQVTSGFVVGKLGVALTVDTNITARYVGQNANASAGAATIILLWCLP